MTFTWNNVLLSFVTVVCIIVVVGLLPVAASAIKQIYEIITGRRG